MNTKLNHVNDWVQLAQKSNWSVTALAKLCRVSVRTLERHFVQTSNLKPKAWMAEMRQKQALELLRDGSSVKETAAWLGYSHNTHFSREFKKVWGFSPSQTHLQGHKAMVKYERA